MLSVNKEVFPKRTKHITGLKKQNPKKSLNQEKEGFTTLLSMFKHLLVDRKIHERELIRRLESFYYFVCQSKHSHVPQPIIKLLKQNKDHLTTAFYHQKPSFFSPTVLQLFCYLFCFRIRIEQREGYKITEQFFGAPKQKFVNLKLVEGCLRVKYIQRESCAFNISQSSSDFIIRGDISDNELKKNILDLTQEKTNDTLLTKYSIEKEEPKRSFLTKQNVSPSMIDLKSLSKSSKPKKKQLPKHIKIAPAQLQKTEEQGMKRLHGRLKFFIKKRDFGFLSLKNGGEMFVHKLDLIESQIDVDDLIKKANTHDIRLSFTVQHYMIRNKPSTKAVSLKIVEMKNLLK